MDADAVARRREQARTPPAHGEQHAWTGAGTARADVSGRTRQGVGAFTPEQGLAALAAIVPRAPSAVVAVSAFDWQTLARNGLLGPSGAEARRGGDSSPEIREAQRPDDGPTATLRLRTAYLETRTPRAKRRFAASPGW